MQRANVLGTTFGSCHRSIQKPKRLRLLKRAHTYELKKRELLVIPQEE